MGLVTEMTDSTMSTSESNTPSPPPAQQEVEEKKEEQTSSTTPSPRAKNLGVKYLAEYYNQDHHRYITDAKEEAPKQKQKLAEYVDYPICLIKHYNYQGEFSHRSMTITSTHLKAALKEMIPSYPSVSFQTSEVSLDAPFHVLYHYWEELKQLKAEEDKKEDGKGTVLADHLETLLGFLDSEFNETQEKVNNLVPEGFISFDVLWALFKPGQQIFTTMLGQPRVLRIKSFTVQQTMCGPIATISCAAVVYNGKIFGEMETSVSISGFVGTEKILNLNAFPFIFHPEKAAMTERLVERGRKYVSMQGINCMEYTGNAVKMTSCGPMKVYSSGRVMIDAATHAQFQPNSGYRSLKALSSDDKKCGGSNDYDYDYDTSDDEYEYSDDEDDEDGSYDRCSPAENADFADDTPANAPRGKKSKPLLTLTDEQCLLCTSLCWGFSLGSKEWYQFFLDKLRPVRWNPLSFEKLVLPPAQKDLVRSLVESHIDPLKTKFDDFVVNKGKGLISVLHGPPGVGKTMTAETVAEFTKSPLYTISAGSLGTTPEGMEASLDKILRLCSIWNAVLLLDEADVYLEERSPHDIKRNALVSIFLRLLEYYEGILFLTTNRVKTFDNAFQSRIHLALSFKDLSKEARSKVWQNFLEKIEVGCKRTIKMSDSDYQYLAGVELNGREIKNAARTALSLADSNGEVLEMRHVKTVLDQVEAFKRDVMMEKSN